MARSARSCRNPRVRRRNNSCCAPAEVVPDEQVPVGEQVTDPLLLPREHPGLRLPLRARPTSGLLGERCRQLFPQPGQGVQHRLGDRFEDVEFADLVQDARPHLLQWLGVKRRAVRRDTPNDQLAYVQEDPHLLEEGADVVVGRVVVEDGEGKAVVPAVVYHRQHAARPVVNLIESQVAAEVSQGDVEVAGPQVRQAFSPPAASTQFWRVAKGTKTRSSRPRCQLAVW
jgi:hypothetical protein